MAVKVPNQLQNQELIHTLQELRERYVIDLIKNGEYSEWNKGILAGKVDALDEVIALLGKQ